MLRPVHEWYAVHVIVGLLRLVESWPIVLGLCVQELTVATLRFLRPASHARLASTAFQASRSPARLVDSIQLVGHQALTIVGCVLLADSGPLLARPLSPCASLVLRLRGPLPVQLTAGLAC